MAGIFWLSSIPGEPSPQDTGIYVVFTWVPPALQNLLHIPVFGALAWLWRWALDAWTTRAPGIIAGLLTAGYGIVDELHQALVPGRYGSLGDMGLNIIGAAIGLWLYQRWARGRISHQDPGC
jgi:uncharacterized membrane protein YeaQ/YmgE (transglycosylase-associated protein family)